MAMRNINLKEGELDDIFVEEGGIGEPTKVCSAEGQNEQVAQMCRAERHSEICMESCA